MLELPPIKVDERLTTFNPEAMGRFNQIMSKFILGLLIVSILLFGAIAIIKIWTT